MVWCVCPRAPDGAFNAGQTGLGFPDHVRSPHLTWRSTVAKAKAKTKTTKLGSVPAPNPGVLYRDRDAMFNHLFDAKMGITAKKATKNSAGKPIAKRGPEVGKVVKQWLRENNTVKSAR